MVNHPAHLRLVRQLLDQDGARSRDVAVGEVSSDRYTSHDRFLRERAMIFSRTPLVVATEAEVGQPGSCLPVEVAGVSLLLVRGQDGSLNAFRNACRHRSTELVSGDAPCVKKAIVCRYHGWTYDLAGRLTHVPHEPAFDGKPSERGGLVKAHVVVRHGLVWASLSPFEIEAHLGGIDEELAALAGSGLTLYRRSTRVVQANWKLIIDAFLDGYHIRHLHKETVYRFFLDARFQAERAGCHIRAVTARRALQEVGPPVGGADLRNVVTPSYLVFPHTTLVLHPDYTSVLTATPLAADSTRFVHWMLLERQPTSDAERDHYTKSFELIDEGVFGREDLAVAEAMQRGLTTGANPSILFGALEYPALWFHQTVDEVSCSPAARSSVES